MIKNLKNLISVSNLSNILKKQVVRNILTVGIITLFLKGVGFYKESVVASHFGLSEILDTFFIASLVPGFIMNVFLGAFQSVFIPNYVAELKSGNNVASFQSTGLLITGLVSLLFMVIAYLFTDLYLKVFFSGHDQEYYDLIISQFHFLLPCIIFWGYSSLLSGLLNINNEFRLSSYSGIFLPICIILSLFFLKDYFGDLVLAFGTLLGSIIGWFYLVVICIKKDILHFSLPNFHNKNIKLMFAQTPAKVSSGFLSGLNSVVDQYFAAQLAIGSIAAINYGRKMPAFLIGLLVVAITNVLLPYFSKLIHEDRDRAFKLVFKMIKITFTGAAVFAIAGIFATDFLVELFFQRKEFTSNDTEIVSSIQKVFLAYIPFAISGMIIVNFLTSINKNAFMAYVSFGALILNIIFDYIFIKYYGILGIAICTTIVIVIKNTVMFLYTYRQSKLV
ncbi:murein biosynthesis integral membrane protein MurJ [Zobellia russellii]|uniref:murein biosynthesis integral membrane protein MurJ n=1 Tax=Zobellia russellii TaxID=248907 RepID=UPI001BFF3387|nr:lipid II flippase MurJ [Zobellia russellii]MBT9189032.1 polysaccharide biosynthesis C-terminal domain-containing protein [Zobellia russellii]